MGCRVQVGMEGWGGRFGYRLEWMVRVQFGVDGLGTVWGGWFGYRIGVDG